MVNIPWKDKKQQVHAILEDEGAKRSLAQFCSVSDKTEVSTSVPEEEVMEPTNDSFREKN